MHRNQSPARRTLLTKLADYGQRHPNRLDVVERFVDLVATDARCFERDNWHGHITGSAWVVDPAGERALLTHHRKLGIWVQLGGHSDGDPDTLQVAQREAREESGLAVDVLDDGAIFDLDIHNIPARGTDPEHLHYDVRFRLRARSTAFTVSDESFDLRWLRFERIHEETVDASVMRMVDKSRRSSASRLR